MSVKDEFTPLPQEYRELPSETSYRKDEENDDEKALLALRAKRTAGAKSGKRGRSRFSQMLVSLLFGATVFTGAAVSGDLLMNKGPVYEFTIGGYTTILDETTVLLTDSGMQSVGALSAVTKVDFSEAVTIAFDIYQSEFATYSNGNGADGVAVSFSGEDRTGTLAAGGYLGYTGDFGVEFDLVENNDEEAYNGEDFGEGHIGILGDSVWHHLAVTEPMELLEAAWHHVELTLEGDLLKVKFDDADILEAVVPRIGDELYVTFTGATGDYRCYQSIANITVDGTLIKIVDTRATDINVITSFENEDLLKDVQDSDEPINGGDSSGIDDGGSGAGAGGTNDSDSNGNGGIGNNSTEGDELSGETDVQYADCETCSGTGIICPGSVAADDPEGCHGKVMVKCKACNNTGYEPNGKLCSWCKGTLEHLCPSFEYHRECDVCGGTGKIIVP